MYALKIIVTAINVSIVAIVAFFLKLRDRQTRNTGLFFEILLAVNSFLIWV